MISTVSQAKYLAHRLTKESKFGEIEKLIPVYLKSGIEGAVKGIERKVYAEKKEE